MIGWLRSALRRLSLRTRVLVLAVLVLGAAVLALAPTHEVGKRSHRPPNRASTTRTRRGAPTGPSPVSAAQLARARRVARTFLAGYLRFAYGRASAASVRAAGHALRWQLRQARDLITPVERRGHPRVVALTALGQASGVVVATALIDDGGITTYAVRLTLRQQRAGCVVNGFGEG